MKTILVLGAGRSSPALVRFLLREAPAQGWHIVLGDANPHAAQQQIEGHLNGEGIAFDILQEETAFPMIAASDLVISLLPPHLHVSVAHLCLKAQRPLITASYVSPGMKAFHDEARAKGLLFLNECGLDPGIDHLSAMGIIDALKEKGGTLHSFESFTGGLIAPTTDPANPWRYKFTWNPRNVVMAGQGVAKFLQDGQVNYVPYSQLFKRLTPVHVPYYGDFEGYANRDSLQYIETYNLTGIKTMVRGTLRHKGFCSAWDVLAQLGCCDDSYALEDIEGLTHAGFIQAFLGPGHRPLEDKIASALHLSPDGPELMRIKWSGFLDPEKIGLTHGTPAQITEHILNKRWKLEEGDLDQVVMWHRFQYTLNGTPKEKQAWLVVTGQKAPYTAMATTVGLPLGMAAKLILQQKVPLTGVQIPVHPSLYTPILAGLKDEGISFIEKDI